MSPVELDGYLTGVSPRFSGPHNGDLDVAKIEATYNGAAFRLGAPTAAPIGATTTALCKSCTPTAASHGKQNCTVHMGAMQKRRGIVKGLCEP